MTKKTTSRYLCHLAETFFSFQTRIRLIMSEEKAQWYFNSSPDPFSSGEPEWTAYSEEDNALIEQKYKSNASKVDLKNYVIHFEVCLQIHKHDQSKQRQIKRELL